MCVNVWFVGWMAGWLVDCMVGMVGCMVACMVACMVGCMVGWLHCWLVAWLVGWLVVVDLINAISLSHDSVTFNRMFNKMRHLSVTTDPTKTSNQNNFF